MKRTFKFLALLTVSLFLFVSGVDATLDHLSTSQEPSSFAFYNQKGELMMAYSGDPSLIHPYGKRVLIRPTVFVPRS